LVKRANVPSCSCVSNSRKRRIPKPQNPINTKNSNILWNFKNWKASFSSQHFGNWSSSLNTAAVGDNLSAVYPSINYAILGSLSYSSIASCSGKILQGLGFETWILLKFINVKRSSISHSFFEITRVSVNHCWERRLAFAKNAGVGLGTEFICNSFFKQRLSTTCYPWFDSIRLFLNHFRLWFDLFSFLPKLHAGNIQYSCSCSSKQQNNTTRNNSTLCPFWAGPTFDSLDSLSLITDRHFCLKSTLCVQAIGIHLGHLDLVGGNVHFISCLADIAWHLRVNIHRRISNISFFVVIMKSGLSIRLLCWCNFIIILSYICGCWGVADFSHTLSFCWSLHRRFLIILLFLHYIFKIL